MSDEECTDDDMTDSDCDIEIPYENENEITYTSPLEHGMRGNYYSSEESDSE